MVINWFGGEPLLAIDIIEEISEKIRGICANQKKTFIAGITTNGYELTYSNFCILKKCNVVSYTITLDGEQSYHNKTRVHINGSPTFDRIIDNLSEIKCKEKSGIMEFIIRTNYTKDNIFKRDEWERFLNERFLSDRRFKYLPRYAWNNSNNKLPDETYIEFEFDDNVSIQNNISMELDQRNHWNNMQHLSKLDYAIFIEEKLQQLKNGTTICPAGLPNSLVIGADGAIYKCQVLFDDQRNKVGSIYNGENEELFNENITNWIEYDTESPRLKNCWECSIYPYCYGIGCAAKSMLDTKVRARWCEMFKEDVLKKIFILTYYNHYLDLEELLDY